MSLAIGRFSRMFTGAFLADAAFIMVPADGNFITAFAKGNYKTGEVQGQKRLLGPDQLAGSEADLCWCEQDELRHCRPQAKPLRRDCERDEEHVCDGWVEKYFIEKYSLVLPLSGWMGDNLLRNRLVSASPRRLR